MLQGFTFIIPKYGNLVEENEDVVKIRHIQNQTEIRCVIADGATQASFSGLWARILVDNTIKYVPSEKRLWNDVCKKAQHEWQNEIAKIDLPWHAEEKIKMGAFSTLLWVRIKHYRDRNQPGGNMKVIAIGDTNMIVVRDNAVLIALPIVNSAEFGNNPYLLSSLPSGNAQVHSHIKYMERSWLPGDQFLLATDALAQYFLRQFEEGNNPITEIDKNIILNNNNHSNFENWVNSLRKENLLRNDDTTLVHIVST